MCVGIELVEIKESCVKKGICKLLNDDSKVVRTAQFIRIVKCSRIAECCRIAKYSRIAEWSWIAECSRIAECRIKQDNKIWSNRKVVSIMECRVIAYFVPITGLDFIWFEKGKNMVARSALWERQWYSTFDSQDYVRTLWIHASYLYLLFSPIHQFLKKMLRPINHDIR